MRQRLVMTITGHVQGVQFRSFSMAVAARYPVVGRVTNQSSGSVLIIAEGEDDVLRSFAGEVRLGPPRAIVKEVIIDWQVSKNTYHDFSADGV